MAAGTQHPTMAAGTQHPIMATDTLHPSMATGAQFAAVKHPLTQDGTMTAILHNLVHLQTSAQLPQGDIDVFDGTDILQFPTFMKAFQCMIEDITKDCGKRLELLIKYTAGEAKDLIRECIGLT
jgi:hypothetical protein